MEKITLRELIAAVGGKPAAGSPVMPDPDTITVAGVCTDNRKVNEGDVFFAFVGERLDAHRFVRSALESGAAGCVISKLPEEYLPGKFYIMVPDTVLAYGSLASRYRERFGIPMIAVTGSVGKTTTKDMLASVLSRTLNTLKTQGNLNNHIGVPTTLFNLSSENEAAVVEMGMNHARELSYLSRLAKPTMAVITNIGDAHIGNLGSKENIFRAKCEVFEGLPDKAPVIVNGDDEYLKTLLSDESFLSRFTPVVIGSEGIAAGADFTAAGIRDTSPDELCFTVKDRYRGAWEDVPLTVPSPGRHMIYPAMTAYAAGRILGIPVSEIREGILNYQATRMRMETHRLPSGLIVLNDTYNANPQSMKAALSILSNQEAAVKIAVVGDMLELGTEEERLHREVGAYAASIPIDVLLTVGKAGAFIADEAEKAANAAKAAPEADAGSRADAEKKLRIICCRDKAEAKEAIKELPRTDTAYLFKASRGMALEELVEELL